MVNASKADESIHTCCLCWGRPLLMCVEKRALSCGQHLTVPSCRARGRGRGLHYLNTCGRSLSPRSLHNWTFSHRKEGVTLGHGMKYSTGFCRIVNKENEDTKPTLCACTTRSMIKPRKPEQCLQSVTYLLPFSLK